MAKIRFWRWQHTDELWIALVPDRFRVTDVQPEGAGPLEQHPPLPEGWNEAVADRYSHGALRRSRASGP